MQALHKYCRLTAGILLLALNFCQAQLPGERLSVKDKPDSSGFPLVSSTNSAILYYDKSDAKVVGIAATAFKSDVAAITNREIELVNTIPSSSQSVMIAGTIGHSAWLDELIRTKQIDVSVIKGGWERFMIKMIRSEKRKILVIAGSDRRGTAFGLFHLSRTMGVSPFVWWADIVPEPRNELYVSGSYTSFEPSVKYRGIFINDEDWGLQPWAANNIDTAVRDIGPGTYAKVFELLLRLKANYIWPAMHPCTKAFYYYKDNPKVADDYAIIVGGSHCEPMLRNNVFEWKENFAQEYGHQPGEWRYDLNKREIYQYWNDRVKESVSYESVYTVGMRGIHDGSMPGPKDPAQKLQLLQKVIDDQRKILGMNFKKPASEVPQIFVPYKEVLSLYRRGLKLPDDVTIVWPDDNYGFIRQLPNEKEIDRKGGNGIYYHLSYWGSPHDYLWLCSTPVSLIYYELRKAYLKYANQLWVFNAGDIKPAELELQFALDFAWSISAGEPDTYPEYTLKWSAEVFGNEFAHSVAGIKDEYYRLAQYGKPEHLSLLNFSLAEASKRLDDYASLAWRANRVKYDLPLRLRDAYFELILYPVLSAKLMNQKILYARMSFLPGDPETSKRYAAKARMAFDSIALLTKQYNNEIAGGKWKGIMSWHPRDLPVFGMPPVKDDVSPQAADSLLEVYFGKKDPDLLMRSWESIERYETGRSKFKLCIGLGFSAGGIGRWPADDMDNPDSSDLYADYVFDLPPGHYKVIVKCHPGFPANISGKLRYSISINDGARITRDVTAEVESSEWKQNVLRLYSQGISYCNIEKGGKQKMRLWWMDDGLVIDTIEFYKE